MSNKSKTAPTTEYYGFNDVDKFFNQKQEGAWIRWMGDFEAGGSSYVYFDNFKNLEIYSTREQFDFATRIVQKYLEPNELVYKFLETTRELDSDEFAALQDKRRCVYMNERYPNMQWLQLMTNMHFDREQGCDKFIRDIRASDIFKGVDVHLYPRSYFDAKDFQATTPQAASVWMIWGVDNSNGIPQLVYRDSEDNIEVYTSNLNAQVRGLPPSQYVPYIRLDIDPDLIPTPLVKVARSRLYQATDSMQASDDQLQDMVMRIKDRIAKSSAQRKDPNANLGEWFPYGDNEEKGDQLAEWTYKPTAGRLPVPPQFYFNPKPLKKGDPSKPPKAIMSTLLDLKLGGAYGDE
jgi:hypothetical protein